jgi:hypothetical protein
MADEEKEKADKVAAAKKRVGIPPRLLGMRGEVTMVLMRLDTVSLLRDGPTTFSQIIGC